MIRVMIEMSSDTLDNYVRLELDDDDLLLCLREPANAAYRFFQPAMLQLIAEQRPDLFEQRYRVTDASS